MQYRIQDLLDMEQLQILLDQLNDVYPFASALVDNAGAIHTATAWQDICVKFHRQNEECMKECTKSDQYILEHIAEANPAVSYRCPHGLIDCAMPIVVDGEHLANFFTGQFFLEEPDLEFFRKQAGKFGFDEDAYMQAAQKVPIWGKEKLERCLLFIKGMIDVMSSASLKSLREIEVRKALELSEERFRALFEQAGDYILIFEITEDKGLVVVDANRAACQVHGYSREEFLGMPIKNFDRALNEGQIRDFLDRAMSGESVRFETAHARKDGTVFQVEASAYLVDTGEGRPLITSVERDITERKQAEAEREYTQKFMQTVIDAFPNAMMVINRDYTIAMANRTVRENLGEKDPVLTRLKCHRISHQSDTPCEEADDPCPLKQVLATRAEVTVQHTHCDAKGNDIQVEIIAAPIFDDEGQVVQIVESCRDITERIKLEEQLRESQKMEAVGQLAGGIAHDFNNLLQAINGYADLALEGLDKEHTVHEAITQVAKAGEKAAGLVRQILAFSRRQVLDIKDVDLNDVIADVIKMIHRVIGDHITLQVIEGRNLGLVRADPGQIEQIVMNLCVNARDAMLDGGTLTVETGNVQIDEEFSQTHVWANPGSFVLLSVTDTGCGIKDEMLDKIFEPFFTTKDVGEGTGLGLSMVYGLVRQHEGMVHAYSEFGKGTTFKIYLPNAERSAPSVRSKIEGPAVGGNETILLAEDNEGALGVAKAMLEGAGYTVLIAVDGEEAVRVFEEHADKISLALLDVMMPKMGGKGVFERIRAGRPNLRFLFASGYSMNAIHTNFILNEGKALIQKPYQRDALLRAVRKTLDA